LVCARVLGYLIRHAPTDHGRTNISNEVMDCEDDNKLVELAQLYINNFIRCFKSAKGPTPVPSSRPSRPSLNNVRETLTYLLKEAPHGHLTSKQQALVRDNYRCMVIGSFDRQSCMSIPSVQQSANEMDANVLPTHAAHIIPQSIDAQVLGGHGGGNNHNYAATVGAVLERFGQVRVVEDLNGDHIHRLENIMTLSGDLHADFNALAFWLEETEELNRYRTRAVLPGILRHRVLEFVTFTSSNDSLPLPDRRYLRLHAACAEVANLSGAGDYIDLIFRRLEDMW
ncbi:hypothetical protein BJV78DRAFT_1135986, partial [Lactifluus subvellereus]